MTTFHATFSGSHFSGFPPSHAASFLAFHLQDNNIIAIGTENSSIQIYNHVFPQLCPWGIDGWDKRKSKTVPVQPGRPSPPVGDTRVQFHSDQWEIQEYSFTVIKFTCFGWDKRKSKTVPVQPGRPSPPVGDTRVQFHSDQWEIQEYSFTVIKFTFFGWDKRKSKTVPVQPGRPSPPVGDTRVQFHSDQIHLFWLCMRPSFAIYDASKVLTTNGDTRDSFIMIKFTSWLCMRASFTIYDASKVMMLMLPNMMLPKLESWFLLVSS